MSSPRASVWTEAAPGRTSCGLRALLLETGALLRTSWVHSAWGQNSSQSDQLNRPVCSQSCLACTSILAEEKAAVNHPSLSAPTIKPGHTHRANRNWELWDEDEGLLSPTVAVLAVAVLGGGMAAPVLPGLLPRLVAWRPVSTCCRAACACCRSNCSCIWSCWSWEAEGPDEFICPPAARRTPDSWDSSSAGESGF